MELENVPEEILMRIFKKIDELMSYYYVSMVSKRWNSIVSDDSIWRRLYQRRWLSTNFDDFLSRDWQTIFRDRLITETKRLGTKLLDYSKREAEEIQKHTKRGTENTFSCLRHSRFVAIGDALRDLNEPSISERDKLMITHVSHENYASAIAQNPKNYIALFSWGYIVHSMAKSFAKHLDVKAAYNFCFNLYESALNISDNGLKEDTLSRWGDALHDFAKTHKSKKEIISILELSYEKFSLAVATSPDSFLAHDYWGLALYTHAKLLKSNTEASDEMYKKCFDRFGQGHDLKPRDGYILCHWGTALQQQASSREGLEAVPIYRSSFAKYRDAAVLLPEDAFVLRSWADSLHDCAKRIIHVWLVAESELDSEKKTALLAEAEDLLEEASSHFDGAVKIRKDYSNALNNWGLSLSTHAKFMIESKADELFNLSYTKFKEALSCGKEESYIICNWGMTLINHARKKDEVGKVLEYRAMMAAAYEHFKPLIFNTSTPDPWSWFCVARWASVDRRFDECREWLEKFQSKDNYIPRATKGQMNYFKNVEHFDWFKDIIERSKKQDPDFIEIS